MRFRELRDVGDPVELGAAYSDGGADELVFLDISASVDGKAAAVDVAARVRTRPRSASIATTTA